MGIQNNQSTNLAKIPQAARIQFNDNATDRNTKLMAEFVRTVNPYLVTTISSVNLVKKNLNYRTCSIARN